MTPVAVAVLVLSLIAVSAARQNPDDDVIKLPSQASRFFRPNNDDESSSSGTRWAVLVAGSSGYWNYRHQADVCHAYQLLRKGGLKEENIVVFMYDDIADNEENPRKGIIINSPHGSDVYEGVPKDYTGDDVTVDNLFAVILGDKTAVKGGSGKVVDSGPNDHIFIFYSDHGGPGVLGMPTSPYLYADDLNDVLKKKHASGTYKSMVFYLEACESGSIFEGLLEEGLNIYATTASNAVESSWGTYCPGEEPSPPPEYETCLGDLYSVAWMEDSGVHNLQTETLRQQYELVKRRTAGGASAYGSHVMQYGDVGLNKDKLDLYMGTNPANDNFTFVDANSLTPPSGVTNQRDADLVHFWDKYRKAPEGSTRKTEAQKQVLEAMSHRLHVDNSVKLVGKLLFGISEGSEVLNKVRPAGQPLADDWTCLKNTVRAFERHCGSLSQYGIKHMRSFANICNAGIQMEQMEEAASQAAEQWLNQGTEFVQQIPPNQLYAAVGVLLFTILFFFSIRLFRRTKSNTVLLSGLSGSGKTVLFYRLRDGSSHQGSVTSMEPNEGTFVLHTENTQKTKPVHLVDVPGHSRLRSKLEEYLPRAAAIVFIVDALEFLPNCRAASEYLYDILTNASVVKNKIPVLLCCNKTDKITAHTKEFIRKQMEKEIEKLRVSRSAVSTADIANDFTLGIEGEVFSFSHCLNKVTVAEASGLTGQTEQVQEFIREYVKP